MVNITFNGITKIINIDLTTGETSAVIDMKSDIYSDWKIWAQSNPHYLPALSAIGGEAKGGGVFVGSVFFLLNGWKISFSQAEQNCSIKIVGEVLPSTDGAQIFDTSTLLASQSLFVERLVPTASELIETGVSGLTAEESAKLSQLPNTQQIVDGILNEEL